MFRRLTNQITKLIDTAHEAAHAVSACVELAREAESNRYSAADALRDGILNKENGLLVDERDQLRVELKSTVQERDQLRSELERVQLALGKATEELAAVRSDRDSVYADAHVFMEERDALAHKLDWITRWRDTPCPFPNGTPVIRHTPIEKLLPSEEWFVYPWRPANLDLYEEFRDA